MTPKVAQQVEALRDMTVTELREQYAEVFGEATRSSHKDFLRKRITIQGGLKSLDHQVARSTIHYHTERPHQALANALIAGGPTMIEGTVEVRDRLGGLLKYYYREAA